MDFYAQGLKLAAAGRHSEAIAQYERVLAEKPDDPPTLFALGNTAKALGMPDAAETFYRRVLALEPGRLEAIINLANLLRAQGQFEAAECLIRPALARMPGQPDLLLALGSTLRESGRIDDAIALYREVLVVRAGDVAAMVNLADCLAERRDDDGALALYDRALKAAPDNAQAKLNRAVLHLHHGELNQGWRDYAARLKVPGKVPRADHGLQRWDGNSLKRARLLVTAEQGVGDHLMFASLIPELAARAACDGGTLLLECEPRLTALFARSFIGVATHDWQIERRQGLVRTHYGWLKTMGGANAAIEIGSLPRLMRKSRDAFAAPHAYLKADAEEAARWQAAMADLPRPLVAVCWRSGSTGGARAVQYADLDAWGEFLRRMPGTAVMAQYDGHPDEIAMLESKSGRKLFVPQALDQKQELDRTAALLSACDAVVSAPTAVSWLAAGLGRPVLKVLYDASWTAFGCDVEPFAPSAHCLMPQTPGDWAAVFTQALERLTELRA
jgi:Flp pilus assembly protein TadD